MRTETVAVSPVLELALPLAQPGRASVAGVALLAAAGGGPCRRHALAISCRPIGLGHPLTDRHSHNGQAHASRLGAFAHGQALHQQGDDQAEQRPQGADWQRWAAVRCSRSGSASWWQGLPGSRAAACSSGKSTTTMRLRSAPRSAYHPTHLLPPAPLLPLSAASPLSTACCAGLGDAPHRRAASSGCDADRQELGGGARLSEAGRWPA